uniref:MarR family transcriptional regulator n=1 Tax=Cronobacter sakazakii TaxID=28141 RepID=UPI001F244674
MNHEPSRLLVYISLPYCLSPTQLYTSLLVTSGAMTNRLNHLEEQGLIKRIADPDDKRSTLVSLTASG